MELFYACCVCVCVCVYVCVCVCVCVCVYVIHHTLRRKNYELNTFG